METMHQAPGIIWFVWDLFYVLNGIGSIGLLLCVFWWTLYKATSIESYRVSPYKIVRFIQEVKQKLRFLPYVFLGIIAISFLMNEVADLIDFVGVHCEWWVAG
jgi:hypothetical protein